MSALSDALQSHTASTVPAPAAPTRGEAPELVEWDGTAGAAQWSTPVGVQPAAYEDIIRGLGFDPADVAVEGAPRVWTGPDGEGGTRAYYWARLVPVADVPQLPDLDRLISRHRPRLTAPVAGRRARRAVFVGYADPQAGKRDARGGTPELVERIGESFDLLEALLERVRPDLAVWSDMGDSIEGCESGGGPMTALSSNDLSLMRQVELAAAIEHAGIAILARRAPEVLVTGVPSNHARWRSGKSNLGSPADDWGLSVLRMLQTRYAETPGLDHVQFAYPAHEYSEHVVLDVLGTRLGLVHGHQVRDANRLGEWWAKVGHQGDPLRDADVLIAGHFHNYRTYPSGRTPDGREGRVIVCPTLDNGSSWFTNGGGDDSEPGLLVLVLEEGAGIVEQTVLRPGRTEVSSC